MGETYASAGVNIDAKNQANPLISEQARSTLRPEVLSGVGFFGGLYEFKGYRQPVLVSSTDSVGTKIKIAVALDKYDTVGIDIVNHCVNDIFTSGAAPLFFLDYIGIGRLIPERVAAIVSGVALACKEVGCALIGGETAELADVYRGNDFDLVGFVIGAVEKDKVIMGQTIAAGDAVLGLPSSGLHTNGYTLARKIFGDSRKALLKRYPELGRTAGEALLEPHTCYYKTLSPRLTDVKGIAHITGGGLVDNVPRILPDGLAARFDSKAWSVPPIFTLMQRLGDIDRAEMFHVFNMGVGMVVVSAPENVGKLKAGLPEIRVIGEIIKQTGQARVIID
ncbi:MAG TPA: phosphoribosylformylglycinamidine cyclo-ligase [Dehalococcoidales bacterium]|nr:MAG: phosphoribosylformylglycinamidine cyclo-ligase [Chloroflexi bacterium RBG_16_60_22]HJX13049.1 phosphoribosylformylglycinamidine cyclo-ligase [Dehalococcoidales bacterium]